MKLFNESFALLNMYCVICLTDLTPNDEVKVTMGNVLIFICCISIGVNLTVMIVGVLSQVYRKIKLYCLKRKHEI
jgi:hypothetical protein